MIDPICNLLKCCTESSEMTLWLLSNQDEGAKQTRRFLNVALECLAQSERVRFKKDLIKRQGGQIDDLLKELVAHQI